MLFVITSPGFSIRPSALPHPSPGLALAQTLFFHQPWTGPARFASTPFFHLPKSALLCVSSARLIPSAGFSTHALHKALKPPPFFFSTPRVHRLVCEGFQRCLDCHAPAGFHHPHLFSASWKHLTFPFVAVLSAQASVGQMAGPHFPRGSDPSAPLLPLLFCEEVSPPNRKRSPLAAKFSSPPLQTLFTTSTAVLSMGGIPYKPGPFLSIFLFFTFFLNLHPPNFGTRSHCCEKTQRFVRLFFFFFCYSVILF